MVVPVEAVVVDTAVMVVTVQHLQLVILVLVLVLQVVINLV